MKIKSLLLGVALMAPAGWLLAQNDNPEPGGPAHPPRGGFHVLPPPAYQELQLTTDQQKLVADLEAQVKAQMEKILTPDQLEKLKQMRPPHPPGGPGDAAGPEGPGGHPPQSPVIAALDLNGDGVIDASELAQASASLKTLDKNGDGKITADEYHPAHPNGLGRPRPTEARQPRPPGGGDRPQRPPAE